VVHSKVSLRRAVDAVQRCAWRVRTGRQRWESGTARKQPANLAVGLRRSPCSSSPTTRPPYVPRPSALDHLDRDMLNLTCSRTATVVCRVSGVH
jgi:hypothetical protein